MIGLSPLKRWLGRIKTSTGRFRRETERPPVQAWRRGWPSPKQLKYLPKFFTEAERRLVRSLTLVAVVSGVAFVILLYFGLTVLVPGHGGVYTEAIVGSPKAINPLLASSNDADSDLCELIYSGLLRYDLDRTLQPDLAESYSISDDGLTYRFVLRENVVWHDGQPFTANDVVFTIQSIQDTAVGSPLRGNFVGVSVTAADDRTVELKLAQAYTPFIHNLTIGILPAHLWEAISPENIALAEQNLKPIGTGPMKFASFTKNRQGDIKSYTVIGNPAYYGRQAHLEEIRFRFYPDTISAIDAQQSNAADGISFVPKTMKAELERKDELVFQNLHLPQYTAVFFNQKNAVLKQLPVKQALALAIDKTAIINDVLEGEADVINGPILPGFVGYNPELRRYDFDPAKAMQTLEDDGWKMDETAGVRVKNGSELRFTLTTVDQDEPVAVANLLKDYWEKIGVGVELSIIDSTRIQRTVIRPRDYEALLFGEIIGTDPDPYPFWHSTQGRDPGLNLSVYVNNDVDELLEGARKTTDEEQRRLKYLHFQNLLADDLPAIFLYNPTYTYGLPKNIKGFNLERISVPSDRLVGAEDWYIKTDRVRKSRAGDDVIVTAGEANATSDEAVTESAP